MSVGFSAIIFGLTKRFCQFCWHNQAQCVSGCCNLSKGYLHMQIGSVLPIATVCLDWLLCPSGSLPLRQVYISCLPSCLASVTHMWSATQGATQTVTQKLVFAMHMHMPLGHILRKTHTQAGESRKLTSAATPCIQRQLPTCEVRRRQEYKNRLGIECDFAKAQLKKQENSKLFP